MTEIWDSSSNNSVSVGTALNSYAYYPYLFVVHPDQCSSCSCENGECVMIDGNEECRCHNGFKNKNDDSLLPCEDIDECFESSPDCDNGVCRNSIGSFSCDCNQGFNNLLNNPSSICGKIKIYL